MICEGSALHCYCVIISIIFITWGFWLYILFPSFESWSQLRNILSHARIANSYFGHFFPTLYSDPTSIHFLMIISCDKIFKLFQLFSYWLMYGLWGIFCYIHTCTCTVWVNESNTLILIMALIKYIVGDCCHSYILKYSGVDCWNYILVFSLLSPTFFYWISTQVHD